MRKNTEAIKKIEQIVRDSKLTPAQFRYVSKRVRVNVGLQIPKSVKSLPQFLTAGEIYFLLDKVKMRPFDALIIETLVFTGLRISELSKLQVQHIDFKEGWLKVVEGKGKKDRIVPLTSNLQSKILLHLSGRTSGFVFCKSNETKYTIRALQYRITKLLDLCAFNKKLSTHSLRHTFACLCVARGISLDKIRDMMGHSSVKITEIYAKLVPQTIKEEFLKLMDVRRIE